VSHRQRLLRQLVRHLIELASHTQIVAELHDAFMALTLTRTALGQPASPAARIAEARDRQLCTRRRSQRQFGLVVRRRDVYVEAGVVEPSQKVCHCIPKFGGLASCERDNDRVERRAIGLLDPHRSSLLDGAERQIWRIKRRVPTPHCSPSRAPWSAMFGECSRRSLVRQVASEYLAGLSPDIRIVIVA
jgi:hypothetical protein